MTGPGSTLTRLPLLPLKNVIIFPRNIVTLLVGKPRSLGAIEDALAGNGRLVVSMLRAPATEIAAPGDVHEVGTLVEIISHTRQGGKGIQVVLEGIARVRLVDLAIDAGMATVAYDRFADPVVEAGAATALLQQAKSLAARYREQIGRLSSEILDMAQRASDAGQLADLLATQLVTDAAERQTLLELADPLERLEAITSRLTSDLDIAEVGQRIQDRVRTQLEKNQRDHYLKEQLKAIQDELGGEGGNEIEALRARIEERDLPDSIREKLLRELGRLERMPGASAEGTVIRTYLDTVLSLPWTEETEDRIDLAAAEAMLDQRHFGLEHVKDRILDFLAVRALQTTTGRGGASPILCLIGPPGVGKTSLGRSIAEAMGRKFELVSLGGVRDEAEIRGHRRTYIGAMPGRVVTAMKQAGVINPLIVLDEIDKLASDYRGDPAAAMLEVLDPEQNDHFTDHFLDLPYSLAKVMFITTANYRQQIPRPLLDRMEVIEVGGYTEDEKIEIARRHLLPRQLEAHALDPAMVDVPEATWRALVQGYTHEAGVRGLDREIAGVCRRAARDIVRGNTRRIVVDGARLEEYLGAPKFSVTPSLRGNEVGVATGLGTTEAGGELIHVEVATMPGRGSLTITGRAGDVMQESARAALSYARTRADAFGIDPAFQERLDLHIHLSNGAMPKDGPSAGITMATALISALVRKPVRADTAMTGEITLRGRVLPIGGLKDKALAAHRSGIKRLIAPRENEREIEKMPAVVREQIEFLFVESMDEVIVEAIDFSAEPPARIPAFSPPPPRRFEPLRPLWPTADVEPV
jgi:ATP-dependent Lon protease